MDDAVTEDMHITCLIGQWQIMQISGNGVPAVASGTHHGCSTVCVSAIGAGGQFRRKVCGCTRINRDLVIGRRELHGGCRRAAAWRRPVTCIHSPVARASATAEPDVTVLAAVEVALLVITVALLTSHFAVVGCLKGRCVKTGLTLMMGCSSISSNSFAAMSLPHRHQESKLKSFCHWLRRSM